jgi:hypothetical protein
MLVLFLIYLYFKIRREKKILSLSLIILHSFYQFAAITRGDEGGADKIDINGVCFMLFIGIYVVLLGRD